MYDPRHDWFVYILQYIDWQEDKIKKYFYLVANFYLESWETGLRKLCLFIHMHYLSVCSTPWIKFNDIHLKWNWKRDVKRLTKDKHKSKFYYLCIKLPKQFPDWIFMPLSSLELFLKIISTCSTFNCEVPGLRFPTVASWTVSVRRCPMHRRSLPEKSTKPEIARQNLREQSHYTQLFFQEVGNM